MSAAAQGRRRGHDPPEAEEVVLQRLELGGGHVLVQRGGVAAHAMARLGQAQGRFLDLTALRGVPGPGAQPAQRERHLGCLHHEAGERGQPAGLRGDPGLEEVEQDGLAGLPGYGRVGERGAQRRVAHGLALDRRQVVRDAAERRGVDRLEHGRGVALQRGVH